MGGAKFGISTGEDILSIERTSSMGEDVNDAKNRQTCPDAEPYFNNINNNNNRYGYPTGIVAMFY